MTTYTDRIARATRALETACSGTIPLHWVEVAQVEATLALAEQQRIANLIALERLAMRYPDHVNFVMREIDEALDTDEIAARHDREQHGS